MSGVYRSWMDNRWTLDGRITEDFRRGVKYFVEFARSHPECLRGGMIQCPCSSCRNQKVQTDGVVKMHLMKFGFFGNYKRWVAHGEPIIEGGLGQNSTYVDVNSLVETEAMVVDEEQFIGMNEMVRVAAGPSFDWAPNLEEPPNVDAKKFMRMMDSANEKVYQGAESSVLEAVAGLLNIKADSNMSQHTYNRILSWAKGLMPKDNIMVGSFYDTKKLVGHIGLGYEKIDCCRNQCMLFYKENDGLQSCSICGLSRYKAPRRGSAKHKRNVPHKQLRYMPLIPRLQRLYASKESSEAMRWHKESLREEGVLTHPSDGEAWKKFDATYTEFAADARNIRLGICSDGFTPFGPAAKSYSCWPVIVTVYNLPPWLCMTDPYMYLSLFIPGPFNPGKNIDVYLRPLIDELKELWNVGVETWDANLSENFNLKAAVMWTINDFPAYAMMSGWSTHGRLACPYCMEDTKAFTLEHYKKQCWFDCHRRFLPVDHPFRKQKNAFKRNTVEYGLPPNRLSGEEVLVNRRYKGIVSKMKKNWFERHTKPQCIDEGVWNQWLAWWDDPKCKKKSKTNKENREKVQVIATGGCIGVADHMSRMRKVHGPHIDEGDTFAAMHTRKGKNIGELEWPCDKNKIVYENYKEVAKEKAMVVGVIDPNAPPNTHIPFDSEAWDVAAANLARAEGKRVNKGGRLIGFGEGGKLFVRRPTARPSLFYQETQPIAPPPSNLNPIVEQQLREEGQQLREEGKQLREEVGSLKDALKKLSEKQEQQELERQQLLQALSQRPSSTWPLRPPPLLPWVCSHQELCSLREVCFHPSLVCSHLKCSHSINNIIITSNNSSNQMVVRPRHPLTVLEVEILAYMQTC